MKTLTAVLLSIAAAWSQQPRPPRVVSSISQIAAGGGWNTTLTLLNPVALSTSVTVSFLGSTGTPLNMVVIVSQAGRSQRLLP